MDHDPSRKQVPLVGRKTDSRLTEIAGMLDGLQRASQSLRRVSGDDAPGLAESMQRDKDQLEGRLIVAMRGLTSNLDAIRQEVARCEENLRILRERKEELKNEEPKEELERAEAAQEAQQDRARGQWTDVLTMIAKIAVDLQWSHEMQPVIPVSPLDNPLRSSPPMGGMAVPPIASPGIGGLISMGPMGPMGR